MNITRRRAGSKRVDVSELRSMLQGLGPSPSLTYGIVYKPTGETSHAEIGDDDVLVHVQLMPDETPVLARLFTAAAGAGAGIWKVPKPGTEVLIALPGDDVEAGPVIVACSPTGSLPGNLDDSAMTIDNPDGDILVQGGTLQVARKSDAVKAATDMHAWISAVTPVVSAIIEAGGGPALHDPTDFGTIDGGADHFKA